MTKIKHYLQRISGPLLDRIDMQLNIRPIDYENIVTDGVNDCESSSDIRERVKASVDRQLERNGGLYNGHLEGSVVDAKGLLKSDAKEFLKVFFDKKNLSMRSYHKVIKIARTIADFGDSTHVELEHIKESVMYRNFDNILKKFDVY